MCNVRLMNKEVVCICSDFVVCATGSTDRLNPFGPFNVDYQVCTPNICCILLDLPELRPRPVTGHLVTPIWCSCSYMCKITKPCPSFCTHISQACQIAFLLGTGSLSAPYTINLSWYTSKHCLCSCLKEVRCAGDTQSCGSCDASEGEEVCVGDIHWDG